MTGLQRVGSHPPWRARMPLPVGAQGHALALTNLAPSSNVGCDLPFPPPRAARAYALPAGTA
jgi:hypothetical protein